MNVAVEAQRALALAILRRSPTTLRRLAGKPIVRDGRTLSPDAQLLIKLAKLFGKEKPEQRPVPESRKGLVESGHVLAPRIEMSRVEAWRVPTSWGSIPLRVYVPRSLDGVKGVKRAPALVYYHGGGFVLGDLDSHDGLCRALADETPCVVIAVDYRLAPEHKFPAAVDDSVEAFQWVHAHAASLGVDPSAIAVGGDSAGGNLAAVTCLALRDAAHPLPVMQLLVYPATDMSRSMASHRMFAEGFLLDASTVDWFLGTYLRSPEDVKDWRASPLYAKSHAGLPAAMVITAGFDPLRDEGDAYAEALRKAGVSVVHRSDEGMFHGYFSVSAGVRTSAEAVSAAARVLSKALRPTV